MNKPKKFAHESEQQLAEIFDYYGVRYVYEPETFPLAWSENGTVTEAICPDFFLPDADVFLELTTLRQPLVTRKNKKARALRKLHPEIDLRLVYKKDFAMLLKRYEQGVPRDVLISGTVFEGLF